MTEALSKTLNHGDFDSVFQEVSQPELVNWTTEGELRRVLTEEVEENFQEQIRVFETKIPNTVESR